MSIARQKSNNSTKDDWSFFVPNNSTNVNENLNLSSGQMYVQNNQQGYIPTQINNNAFMQTPQFYQNNNFSNALHNNQIYTSPSRTQLLDNHLNQINTKYPKFQVQAPPGLQPKRKNSYQHIDSMSDFLFDSLHKQELIISDLEKNKEELPLKQIEQELLINQVDRQALKIFCYDESDILVKRKVNSCSSEANNEQVNVMQQLEDFPYISKWLFD